MSFRTPVTPNRVRKGKAVYLVKDITMTGFGNRRPIIANPIGGTQRTGYITSNGFEGTQVRVHFPLYGGDENLTFNTLSAQEYLECDPF